ncbi:MAG: ferritin family protein [bacterium]|jgi:rubrerythrin|nr:ferritin family protein [bacterium]MDD4558318.1 ferritin family protein [bacterium]
MHIAPTEILEIAVAIETNGAIFYRRAAESTDDPEIRKLCLRLAAEEDDHRARFKRIYSHEGIPLDLYDGNREAHAYMRTLASLQIYDDARLDLSSPDKLLETAITLEKESLLYYQHLKAGTAQEKNQRLLEEIITEEQAHVIKLNEQLERNKNKR